MPRLAFVMCLFGGELQQLRSRSSNLYMHHVAPNFLMFILSNVFNHCGQLLHGVVVLLTPPSSVKIRMVFTAEVGLIWKLFDVDDWNIYVLRSGFLDG